MKSIKRICVVLLLVAVIFCAVACVTKDPPVTPPTPGSNLKPDDIPKLAAITNYGREAKYTTPSRVTYSDTSAENAKLSARIAEKKEEMEEPGSDVSSIVKIFANSEASMIIDAMSKAALPADKMTKTVNYLAGEESVTDAEIQAKVNSGTFSRTSGWSFFDDWTYYEKLQDKADAAGSTDKDADNVKRQYRNILGKVFAIEMTGDEFARVATYELAYATDVVEGATMAGSNISIDTNLNAFDEYCMENLDYETLVYLRAFNDYYKMDGSGTGLADCVEIYGYYYEYNRTSYYSQSDEDFESQLKYGHMTVFLDAEWLDYVRIQRASYTGAYRYDDVFYNTFYNKHFTFQEKIENHEMTVYKLSKWQSKSYTEEMREATRDSGINGQLNFTDWLWCYSGDSTVMTEYNQANTAYERGKNGSADQEYAGKFQYEMQQLKMVDYILTNMTTTNLGRTLRFQVYSYSGEVVRSAQSFNKDTVLVNNGHLAAEDAIFLIDGLPAAEQKEYATGKIGVILTQLASNYRTANVESKASNTATQPWAKMREEIQYAINYTYTGTNEEKVERLEDLVVKMEWDCGAAIDETCKKTPAQGHVTCKKQYDTKHNISQFVSNYEAILRYMAGQTEISFQGNVAAKDNKLNNYVIEEYTNLPQTRTAGYKGTLDSTIVGDKISYEEIKAITVSAGQSFAESVDGEDKTWWTGKQTTSIGSAPAKATSSNVQETTSSQQVGIYTYSYTFAGWYLDKNLKYLFDERDKVTCDLLLYAGYDVRKSN